MVDSLAQVEAIFARDPGIWLPDNLFLLQEYLPHDPERGIVRLEFLGGELLYAMRVVTHGRFNLCPSPVCNPDDGAGACEMPAEQPLVERRRSSSIHSRTCPPTPSPPRSASSRAARLDVGGIEYLETPTAGASSTTSTRTRTCAPRSPRHSGSIRSSGWWISWSTSFSAVSPNILILFQEPVRQIHDIRSGRAVWS